MTMPQIKAGPWLCTCRTLSPWELQTGWWGLGDVPAGNSGPDKWIER